MQLFNYCNYLVFGPYVFSILGHALFIVYYMSVRLICSIIYGAAMRYKYLKMVGIC